MDLMKLPIVDILRFGLAGLVFLLALLGFVLLMNEQKKASPSDQVLKSIRFFMFLGFVSAVIVALSDFGRHYFNNSGPVKVVGRIAVPPDPKLVKVQALGVKEKPWYLPPSGELSASLTPLPDVYKLSIAAPGYEPEERIIDRDEIKRGHSDIGEVNLRKTLDKAQLDSPKIVTTSEPLKPLLDP